MRMRFIALVALMGLFFAALGLCLEGGWQTWQVCRQLNAVGHPVEASLIHSADSVYWLSYAREMIDRGTLRVRHTRLDNAPYGRENTGWASLNAWYLVGLGAVWSAASGMPLREAIVPASAWANPILFLALLGGLLVAGWRSGRFSCAAIAVLVLGTTPLIYSDFGYGEPDHHGWHDIACFSTLLCLALGLRTGKRRWFAGAGVAVGVAFWIGATQQAFLVAASLGGAMVAMLAMARSGAKPATTPLSPLPAPECWRWFGIAAGAFSLLFYLVEFAPGPVRMRLEVNHPLYSLGLLMGGEFLCRLQRLCGGSVRKGDWAVGGVCGLALAALAAACLAGPAEWHCMHQPFIRRMHRIITEFQPIFRVDGWASLLELGAPGLLVLGGVAGAAGAWRSPQWGERAALLVCVVPCAACIGLSLLQMRWGGLAGTCAAAVAVLLFANEATPFALRRAVIGGPLLLAGLWGALHAGEFSRTSSLTAVDQLATLQVMHLLQDETAGIPVPAVLFAGQRKRQATIGYLTGIPTVGSLYWDNPDGARDEALFFATDDEQEARRIALARGVTHVSIVGLPGIARVYRQMAYGDAGDANVSRVEKTLAYRLATTPPTPPSWLRLLPARGAAMELADIRVYRVVEPPH